MHHYLRTQHNQNLYIRNQTVTVTVRPKLLPGNDVNEAAYYIYRET